MKNLEMFCTSLEPDHYNFIKKLGYIPVGLGSKNFQKGWIRDNSGENISTKNKNYAECTFHYWLWKNHLKNIETKWIGFCHYRKFWTTEKFDNLQSETKDFSSIVLKNVPQEYDDFDVILGKPFYVNQRRTMKFIKKGIKIIMKNPSYLYNQSKRTIKFHFDIMHGENNLNKAINLLDDENKEDFKKYVNTKQYFHPFNMFICKSKELLNLYYQTLFPWLKRCENIFSSKDLQGYDLARIYAFLAERFTSYWFEKNAKFKTMDITYYDIIKKKN